MRKQRLSVLIILLILTVMASTTTTFAWLSIGKIVRVESVEFQLASNGGLEISIDGMNYVSILNSDDLNAFLPQILERTDLHGNKEVSQFYLDNVTPILTNGDFGNKLEFLTLNDKGKMINALPYNNSTMEGSYFHFNLKFRANSAANVKLNSFQLYSALSGNRKPCFAPFDIDLSKYSTDTDFIFKNNGGILLGNPIPAKIENAVRLGFVSDFNISGNTVNVFNPNSDKGFNKANLAQHYYNYMYNASLGDTHYIDDVNEGKSIKAIVNGNTQQLPLVTLQQNGNYYYGEISVYVWIEGKDGDCFDAILSDSISLGLRFSI
ncbi:MAG: hypothetical protein RR054_01225 [Clostridia bacterium]